MEAITVAANAGHLGKHVLMLVLPIVYVSSGLKIIREGGDYFLIHQGEIQRYLGSRKRKSVNDLPSSSKPKLMPDGSLAEESCRGILDEILFFIGDLEVASADAKRGRSP